MGWGRGEQACTSCVQIDTQSYSTFELFKQDDFLIKIYNWHDIGIDFTSCLDWIDYKQQNAVEGRRETRYLYLRLVMLPSTIFLDCL